MNSYIDITKNVPELLLNFKLLKNLYTIEGEQIGKLLFGISDLEKQLSINTATWGLDIWEREYGITKKATDSYEQRREVVLAKKRGQGTTTKYMIKKVAESFAGGEVEIIENNSKYLFTVKFVGVKGIPASISAFKNMLDDIKPAHLAYELEYTYNTHSDLSKYTHAQLQSYTHYQLRNEAM